MGSIVNPFHKAVESLARRYLGPAVVLRDIRVSYNSIRAMKIKLVKVFGFEFGLQFAGGGSAVAFFDVFSGAFFRVAGLAFVILISLVICSPE